MPVVHIYKVEESRLPVWFHALTHMVFNNIRFNISKKFQASFDNRPLAFVREIQVFVEGEDVFEFLEHYVSRICYNKGYIQNLTKKENPHVREDDRQVSEKVCPSTGEACKHDNGSSHCDCEGESKQPDSKPDTYWFDIDSYDREEDFDPFYRPSQASDSDVDDCL